MKDFIPVSAGYLPAELFDFCVLKYYTAGKIHTPEQYDGHTDWVLISVQACHAVDPVIGPSEPVLAVAVWARRKT